MSVALAPGAYLHERTAEKLRPHGRNDATLRSWTASILNPTTRGPIEHAAKRYATLAEKLEAARKR